MGNKQAHFIPLTSLMFYDLTQVLEQNADKNYVTNEEGLTLLKYLTTKELKAKGWTAGMIKLLGHAHKTIDAGIFYGGDGFKSRIFSNAWRSDHVATVESSDDWQYLNQRQLRRKALKREI